MTIVLTGEQARTLYCLANGGRIEGRRVYPKPMVFWLWRPAKGKQESGRYADPLALITVSRLLELGLVEAVVLDSRWHEKRMADTVDYQITEPGRDAALNGGEITFDEGWAGEFFPDLPRKQEGAA